MKERRVVWRVCVRALKQAPPPRPHTLSMATRQSQRTTYIPISGNFGRSPPNT